MPYCDHMFKRALDMSMATMYAYPSSKYALPSWKKHFCAVHNFHVFIFQVQSHISTMRVLAQKYALCVWPNFAVYHSRKMRFKWKATVLIVWGFLWFNSNWKTIYNKRAFRDGHIHFGLLSTFLHTCGTYTCITLDTVRISKW